MKRTGGLGKLRIPVVAMAALLAIAALTACGTAADNEGPAGSSGPTAAPPSPESQESPAGDIVFDMEEEYQPGEPVEVAIRNNSDTTYYYQSYYPACYNVKFFDDSGERRPYPYANPGDNPERLLAPGEFIVPAGTHCDMITDESIQPGERAELLVWEQKECVKDRWGCVESAQVEPGRYGIAGEFASEEGVIAPAGDDTQAGIATAEWTFAISAEAGLEFDAEADVSSDGATVNVSASVTNVSDETVRMEHGGCALRLRVHKTADRSGEPIPLGELAPDSGTIMVCDDYLTSTDVEPGETASPDEFQLTAPAAYILGGSVPEGRYYFTAVLKINGASVEVPAGDAELSRGEARQVPENLEITCEPRSLPSQEEIDEKLAEIPERVTRLAYLRTLYRGTGEIVPGFGGHFVDGDDNDIAYIYLLDPDDEELVAQAAEILRERLGRDFEEVRPIQGQYSYSQLLDWINCWDAREPALAETESTSGISERDNRITIRVASQEDVALAERELEALGIPLEAAEIKIVKPEGQRWGFPKRRD